MMFQAILLAAIALSFGCGKKTEDIEKKRASLYSGKEESSATEALYHAIDSHENILAREAIKQGAKINATFSNGETPLTFALKKEKISLVRTILNAQADVNLPNKKNEFPAHVAIQSKDRHSLYLLLQRDVDLDVKNHQGQTPLLMAITNEDELAALELVKKGAALNCRDRYGFNALELSEKMNFQVLADLIAKAIETQNEGFQAASAARFIGQGDAHFLEYLLRHHSLKEVSNGLNPLSLVLKIEDDYARHKALKLFLRHGFDPNGEPADTKAPLSEAVKMNDFFAFNTLLLNRADPNLLDDEYKSPLAHAVESLSFPMVKKLVYYEAAKTYEYERDDIGYVMDVCKKLPSAGFFMFRRINSEERKERDSIKEFLDCM